VVCPPKDLGLLVWGRVSDPAAARQRRWFSFPLHVSRRPV